MSWYKIVPQGPKGEKGDPGPSVDISGLEQEVESLTTQLADTATTSNTLATSAGVYIDNFPRLTGETDDYPRVLRAINALGSSGGTVKFGKGTYHINSGTLPAKQNIDFEGAGRRSTILKSSAAAPIFRAQNALTGRTQQIGFRNMKFVGNDSMKESILDLTGTSYLTIENVEVWGNEGSTSIPAIGINFPKGLGLFNGYIRFINTNVVRCSYGLYGDGNNIYIEGGAYNVHENYCIYLSGGADHVIINPEASIGLVGGIYSAGDGVDISGCWFEYNGTRVSGLTAPNDINVDNAKRVRIGANRYGSLENIKIHGETPLKGHEFYNQIVGNGEVSVQNIIPNGAFEFVDSDDAPLGWTLFKANSSFRKLTTDLPKRYKTGTRMVYNSNVPQIYRTVPVVEGEIISFVGWARLSDGITNARIGIFNASSLSSGSYVSLQAGARNKWIRYQVQYVVPPDVTSVRIGVSQAYGGTAGVDYIDITGFNATKGEHAFFDGEAPITSAGGEIWSQEFKIGGKRIGHSAAMPTTGSYSIGDYVRNTNTIIVGTAGAKYVVRGWIRTTVGTNHVLNTDWVEDRVPTGT